MVSVSDFVSEDNGTFSLTVNGFVPRTALVPFVQERGSQPDVLVKVGDRVLEGQTIAQTDSCSVQATIPGIVEDILITHFPNGKQGNAAKINLGGSFSYTGKKQAEIDWQKYDASTIQQILTEKGVVNTFSKCQSLTGQIKSLHPKSARILAVRLFDDDPARVTESFISAKFSHQVAVGAAVVARAMSANGIAFVYDSAKENPLAAEIEKLTSVPVMACGINAGKYPAGFMHQLVSEIKRNATDKKPFDAIGNRDLFVDSATLLAAFNAVVLSVPLMERYVHVTGDCLNAAAIMKVKIGTTLGDLATQCGGFKRSVAKIIINGIVTGAAVSNLSIPVTKMVKSVSFLPAKKARKQYDEKCVRCGACRKICPVGLYPDILYRTFIHKNKATDLEKNYAATHILCTGCGLCSAVCPSRIPLAETAALLKGTADEK